MAFIKTKFCIDTVRQSADAEIKDFETSFFHDKESNEFVMELAIDEETKYSFILDEKSLTEFLDFLRSTSNDMSEINNRKPQAKQIS